MPLYGVPQAGYNPPPDQGLNLASLEAGQTITLLSGTETLITGSASVAFAKGFHDPFNSPVSFNLSGCSHGTVVSIQQASVNVAGNYTTVADLTPDSNGNQTYTLTDSVPFTRAYVKSFVDGDAPVLMATRL